MTMNTLICVSDEAAPLPLLDSRLLEGKIVFEIRQVSSPTFAEARPLKGSFIIDVKFRNQDFRASDGELNFFSLQGWRVCCSAQATGTLGSKGRWNTTLRGCGTLFYCKM
jgi:hypothetical protein